MGSSGSKGSQQPIIVQNSVTQPVTAPPYSNAPPPAYSQQTPPHQGYGQPAAGFQQQPYGYQGVQPQQQQQYRMAPGPNRTTVVQGGFDAGARFDNGRPPAIPPPPPGFAPNAAQAASMQGQNVVVTQQQSSFWSGSGDGGMVIW